MAIPTLDGLLSGYLEVVGPDTAEAAEMTRFREFLLRHGGLRKLAPPGRKARILDGAGALRCFHFSQYLDWYLAEKEGVSRAAVEKARVAMSRFNEWLFEKRVIPVEDFEENRESILGGEEGPPVYEEVGAGSGTDGAESGDNPPEITEEKDFYVPGEYTSLLSGEFVLTKVQEGILYGVRDGERREIGPILVDRSVSSGHKVGDRVHLSLGKAGDHWNLLTRGRGTG